MCIRRQSDVRAVLNPLMAILKTHSNTVIGTLAVDGWAVPNVTSHHQRPVHKLRISRCGTIITCAL